MAGSKNLEGSPFEAHRRLVYVTDSDPGISRRKIRGKFAYFDAEGTRLEDEETLERIRFLAIPPAYADVWICARAHGHLQATGRDDRDRKQYRYHPAWSKRRQLKKFRELLDFASCLPGIRRRVALDLQKPGLRRERVLAALVRLLEATHIRIGNAVYAKENSSFGLTTLKPQHVEIEGSEIHFEFVAKGGKAVQAEARHPAVAKLLARCQELPGQHLFGYRTRKGAVRAVTSSDVNAYLQKACEGKDISAKDFRTWNGTVLCAQALAETGPAETEAEEKRNIVAAVKETARALRNRPATCRAYYIHPQILEAYGSGQLAEVFAAPAPPASAGADLPERYHLKEDERRVLKLLGETARKR